MSTALGLFGDVPGIGISPGSKSAGFGANTVTVGAGGQYTDIQAAIDSITDNLPVSYSTGTVSVTNGSAQITFSSAPANDKVVAGRDLFSVDGVRFYQIKNGPTTLGGAIFNLAETYQGSTNAAASFSIYKPNPRTVLLLPGVYDYTGVALARNILLKPYVNLVGVDRDSCVIRRNKDNPSSETTPLLAIGHGASVFNLTLDSVDGHFMVYRMGLTARATTQTQAMKNSRWVLRNVALVNKDPNGIDSGADYDIDNSFYNDDEVVFDRCYFEHCWDGFTWNTRGGRFKATFNNPVIYKTPLPLNRSTSGAAFIRAGYTAASTADVLMVNPVYDQVTYASGETLNDGLGGLIARMGGAYGMLFIGSGATGKVVNPAVDINYGTNYGRAAGVALGGTNGACSVTCVGGYMNVLGAGGGDAQDYVSGAFNDLAAGILTISGTNIDAGKHGVYQKTAGGITNLQGGARIKGATNSLVNTAGTMNKSANISTVGAESGTITTAET